jgi:hypothetical protein
VFLESGGDVCCKLEVKGVANWGVKCVAN